MFALVIFDSEFDVEQGDDYCIVNGGTTILRVLVFDSKDRARDRLPALREQYPGASFVCKKIEEGDYL